MPHEFHVALGPVSLLRSGRVWSLNVGWLSVVLVAGSFLRIGTVGE